MSEDGIIRIKRKGYTIIKGKGTDYATMKDSSTEEYVIWKKKIDNQVKDLQDDIRYIKSKIIKKEQPKVVNDIGTANPQLI